MTAADVVIAIHDPNRWAKTTDAISSVLRQSLIPDRLVVVVDHNRDLWKRASEAFGSVATVIENNGPRGASGARNSGARCGTAEVIAFLDDDARAETGWLRALTRHFTDATVVGVGGYIEPLWEFTPPWWFPAEFSWTVGGSIEVRNDSVFVVRNVWSGNMAVKREVFSSVGGFNEEFGKMGSVSRPEDTEFCLRVAGVYSNCRWLFDPSARVWHHVPASRGSFRYFLRRNYLEGRGKIELARLHKPSEALSDERRYVTRVVPMGIARRILDFARDRDARLIGQAGAMVVGLGTAGVGALGATTKHMLTRRLTPSNRAPDN